MIVLDAQALIAFLTDEPARREVDALLRSDERPALSAASLAEVVDALLRVKGVPLEVMQAALRPLLAEAIVVVPVDAAVGELAGELRSAHYDRKTCPISLGDALALATGLTHHGAVATSDPAMLQVAHALGLEQIALPDQWGNRSEVDVPGA